MLRKMHRTNMVLLDPKNAVHRTTIERAHERNLPVIETIVKEGARDDGRHFIYIFKAYAQDIVIPEELPHTTLKFADNVVVAWISSTGAERADAVRIPAFGWGGNSSAFAFFGRDLEGVVRQARPLATRITAAREAQKSIALIYEGRIGLDVSEQMSAHGRMGLDVFEDQYQNPRGPGIPDTNAEERMLRVHLLEIVRRLTVGFSPRL